MKIKAIKLKHGEEADLEGDWILEKIEVNKRSGVVQFNLLLTNYNQEEPKRIGFSTEPVVDCVTEEST